jgi:hypothetical protein
MSYPMGLGFIESCAHRTRPARTTLQQDPSAHVYWESLIAEAKRPRAQNWCCFYRPRRGVSHTRIGYALSLICMFLIWLVTLLVPYRTSLSYLICMSHIRLVTLLVPYRTSLSCLGQAVFLQKTFLHMYTLVVCPILCVVASSSQCHSATAHVASHKLCPPPDQKEDRYPSQILPFPTEERHVSSTDRHFPTPNYSVCATAFPWHRLTLHSFLDLSVRRSIALQIGMHTLLCIVWLTDWRELLMQHWAS